MKKKFTLRLPEEASRFTLLGLSSHENHYRLAWSINGQLGCGLVQTDDFIPPSGQRFSCFAFTEGEAVIQLIDNRCDNGFLIPSYRKFDYIMKFDCLLNESVTASWIERLKAVPLVAAVVEIPCNRGVLQYL